MTTARPRTDSRILSGLVSVTVYGAALSLVYGLGFADNRSGLEKAYSSRGVLQGPATLRTGAEADDGWDDLDDEDAPGPDGDSPV